MSEASKQLQYAHRLRAEGKCVCCRKIRDGESTWYCVACRKRRKERDRMGRLMRGSDTYAPLTDKQLDNIAIFYTTARHVRWLEQLRRANALADAVGEYIRKTEHSTSPLWKPLAAYRGEET